MRIKRKIKSTANYLDMIFRCIIYNIESLANVNVYPKFLVFYTTFRCNSRCKACNVWKGNDTLKQKKELTIDQIDKIFSNSLFSRLRHINVQGGEATLREDIVEVIETIIKKVTSLKTIALTSNGLDTEIVVPTVKQLYNLCRKHGIYFSVAFSIDGVGEYHDFARGKDAFKRVSRSIQALGNLREMPGFGLGTNCVLTARNIYNISEIVKFQREVFNTKNLTVVEFRDHFLNKKGSPESKMLLFTENPKERSLLISYLKQNNYPHSFGDFMTFRYEQLRAMLEDNGHRTQSCQYKISGLVLDYRGELMLCPVKGRFGSCLEKNPSELFFSNKTKQIRKQMSMTTCLSCYPYNFYAKEIGKDLLKYTLFFLRSRIKKRVGENGSIKTKNFS